MENIQITPVTAGSVRRLGVGILTALIAVALGLHMGTAIHASNTPAGTGEIGAAVRERLYAWGYYRATAHAGERTGEAALAAFRRAQGMTPSGGVDAAVLWALGLPADVEVGNEDPPSAAGEEDAGVTAPLPETPPNNPSHTSPDTSGVLTNALSGTTSGARWRAALEDTYILLAQLITAEVNGEDYAKMVAVGREVLAYTADPAYPDTVAGVIWQEGVYSRFTADPQIVPRELPCRAAAEALWLAGWGQ